MFPLQCLAQTASIIKSLNKQMNSGLWVEFSIPDKKKRVVSVVTVLLPSDVGIFFYADFLFSPFVKVS